MKKFLFSIPALFTAFPALAHADEEVNCSWQNMMGNWGGGMMGSFMGGSLFFIAPLISLAFWGLVIALLVALVRWVWKRGDEKK